MAIVFRTTGPWGAGLGADLAAADVDSNFYELLQDVIGLQNAGIGAGIDHFNVVGNSFYVVLTDHTTLGPYALPSAQWNFRGQWQANTPYAVFDVVTDNGSVYLILEGLTSDVSFNPNATDGLGNPLYGLLLTAPSDVLPPGGEAGQVLTSTGVSPFESEWTTPTRNIALYVEGKPTAGELVAQYATPEPMTLPQNLVGSIAIQGTHATTACAYQIFKNGNAIGTINFTPSPSDATFTFSAPITFEPGDVLQIFGPSAQDASHANISITLQALLP